MKRIRTVTLAFLLAFSLLLTGCSSDDNNTNTVSPTTSGEEVDTPVSIDIFQYKVEIVEPLQEAIEAYTTLHPNVSIALETVGGGDDIGTALKAKFQSGSGPVIYNIGGPSDVELYEDKLEDLSDQPWVKHAIEGTLTNATKDGKVYGLPYATEGFGLVYNKEIFQDAGVDLSTLNSFEGIESAFALVQQKIDSGELKEKYPLLEAVCEVPGKEAWVWGDHAANLPLGAAFGYDTFKAYEADTLDFGEYGQGYKEYIDLQIRYSKYKEDPSKSLAVDYATQVSGGLALERVACTQQGNWIYGDLAKIDESVAQKMAFMPAPLKGTAEDSIYILVPMYWCVNSNATDEQKKVAKDFLNWLYQSDEGKQIIVEDFGFIPPFDNYDGMEPEDPLAQSILQYADEGKVLGCVFKGFPDGWSTNVMGAKVQGYIGGTLTWEQALQQAADSWAESRK